MKQDDRHSVLENHYQNLLDLLSIAGFAEELSCLLAIGFFDIRVL